MKHCYITPTKYINDSEIGSQSDFLLVLSHLLNYECDNQYAEEVKKFQRTWKQIYLDNWLFENWVPEDWNNVIDKAIKLNVDYVFAPDHLFDSQKTAQEFEWFAKAARERWYTWKLWYVVQAKDPMEYVMNYVWAECNSQIDLIWLSILSIPESFGGDITSSRIKCIDYINTLVKPQKPAHLLWLWWSLKDLEFAKNYPWIISNDSCSAFMTWVYWKQYDCNLSIDWWKVKEKVNFEFDNLDQDQRDNIKANIRIIKMLLND